ncbi:MAG TPA: LytTR family DNA-binding domain-containing protein [Puia sp.]|jgi:DNA-binding LytR/AlgR family response regulator
MLNEYIFFRYKGALKKLNVNDIVVLEAADNYVKFFSEEGVFLVRITLDAAVKSLPSTNFVRVHRLYAVAIKDIDTLAKDFLTIKDLKDQIPVSKQYYLQLLKKIKILHASSFEKGNSVSKKSRLSLKDQK